jgi:hypothetical protein
MTDEMKKSDPDQADPTKTAVTVQRLVELLGPLGSVARQRAVSAAMVLLGEYAHESGARIDASEHGRPDGAGGRDPGDVAAFFNRDEDLKPSDNAYLCAAYHYAQYGPVPFSLQALRDVAAEAGVVIPDRVDMTLRAAGKGGKKLFQNAGQDAYKPTATGGLYFKERWGVTPGRKPKPVEKDS